MIFLSVEKGRTGKKLLVLMTLIVILIVLPALRGLLFIFNVTAGETEVRLPELIHMRDLMKLFNPNNILFLSINSISAIADLLGTLMQKAIG